MEEQLEYFLEYQYKKEELKTYITNKINDAMHKLFGLRYVRTTLIDNILFEGEMYPDGESGLGFDLYRQEIPHFLENELTYTIVNRKDIPGFSFMDCQFYYDAVLRKVYLYYVIDPNNRWGRPDLVKDMYKAINESLPNRTVISVAHRLTTIKNYNVIHVIKNGSIVESGTYEGLIEKDGEFCRMIDANIEKIAGVK